MRERLFTTETPPRRFAPHHHFDLAHHHAGYPC
jgi:hypothetical protein